MTWLRNNAFIAASIALPILLGLSFSAARTIPALFVAKPIFDGYFTSQHYIGNSTPDRFELILDNMQISARIANDDTKGNSQKTVLYRFDAQTQRVHKVNIETAMREPIELVSVESIAPDGYRFNSTTQYSNGVVTRLFGITPNHAPAISYKGRLIQLDIPKSTPYNYSNYQILGWSK